MAWTLSDAAHLLRRGGFGGSTQDVNALFAKGRDPAIDYLVEYTKIPDPAWDQPNPLGYPQPTTDNFQATLTMLYRFIASTRPLQARLTWFWHGHFTSSMDAAGAELMTRQINTWRAHATGNFREFLLAMYKDGAMLRFLDGDPSTKFGPNENFARENMELFTTGVGPYKEKDVKESARAFTGWEIGYPVPNVSFNASAHDFDSKTILGRTGHFGGDDVMKILSDRYETRRRICTKLCQHFVRDMPSSTIVQQLISVWVQTDGNLKAVVKALLKSDAFWESGARRKLVMSSMEYVVGLIQRLGHRPTRQLLENVAWRMPQMGQAPFNPPNPAGYATSLRLSGASMLLSRYQFAYYVIYEVDPTRVVNRATLGMPSNQLPAAFVAWMTRWLGITWVTPTTSKALADYLGTAAITGSALREKTLGVLYLLACSPEYQVI